MLSVLIFVPHRCGAGPLRASYPSNLREFVLTHVILAPGARGGGVRAAGPATTSGDSGDAADAADAADEFQKACFCAQARYLRALDPFRSGSSELWRQSKALASPG